MSNLTAFPFIGERSEATPGLWNRMFSQLSDNIRSVAEGPFSGSTDTLSFSTNLEVTGGAHFQFLSVGSTPPSYVTTALITMAARSDQSDYLYFTDSSGLRSNYVIGSRAGGTADGLNIWDASGATMIASFSKQSIRFYQNVVGPVFDVGGALAATYNAATFGGSTKTVQIGAAILQAVIDGIPRVYVPASMYPFNPTGVPFSTAVQMVREGGDWSVYDVFAYGAKGLGFDAASIQAAANGAAANSGTVFFPAGTYNVGTSITLNAARNVQFRGPGANGALVAMAASGVTLLNFTGVTSGLIIRDLWLGSFVSYAAGASIGVVGTVGTHSDTIEIQDVTVQNTPNMIVLENVDRATLRTIHAMSSITSAVVGPALSMRTVISTVVDDFDALASAGSYPSDVVDISHDCDTIFVINSQALHATGNGFRCRNAAGTTGPRLIRFTNCLAESNTSAGFSIEAGRDVRLSQCESSLNSTGYVLSGGTSVTVTDSLAYQNNGHGYVVLPGAAEVRIESNGATNNGQSIDNISDGIYVASNVTTGVIVSNNRSGDFILPGLANKQRYGLSIGTSTDSLMVVGNDFRFNKTGDILNYSTGVANLVIDSSNLTSSSGGTLTARSGMIVRNTLLVGGDIANGGEILRCNSHARFAGYVIVTGASGAYRMDNRTSSGSSQMTMYNQTGMDIRFGNSSTGQEFMFLGSTVSSSISLCPTNSATADLGSLNRPWGTLSVRSGISVGVGGSLIPQISSLSSLIGAFVVQPSASSFTVVTWAAVQAGDQILTTIMPDTAVSSLSSGLVLHSHATKAGQIEMRLSNVSTLAQNQSSKTYFFTRISPF